LFAYHENIEVKRKIPPNEGNNYAVIRNIQWNCWWNKCSTLSL